MMTDVHLQLEKAKILMDIDAERIEKFIALGSVKPLQKEDILVKENSQNEYLYIILDGVFEVLLPQDAEHKMRIDTTRLAKLTAGDCIGEYSLVDHKPSSAEVRAHTDARVFAVSYTKFAPLLEQDHTFAKQIYKNLVKIVVARARATNDAADLYLINM